MPNAPKERYSDPETGAHFEYNDMCARLERMVKKRFLDSYKTEKKALKQEFIHEMEAKAVEIEKRIE